MGKKLAIMSNRGVQCARNALTFDVCAVFVVGIVLCSPLLTVQHITAGHDFPFQINRLRSFWHVFSQHQFLPQIDQDGYFSMGIAAHIIYPPLTSILSLALKILSPVGDVFSTNFAVNSMLILIVLGCGFSMRRLVLSVFKSRIGAAVSAIIYMSMPYLFTDILGRAAYPEAMAMSFLPLLFLGIYNLAVDKPALRYLVISMTGIVLAHQLSVMIAAIFAVPFGLVFAKRIKLRNWGRLAASFAVTLGLCSFWLMPFFELSRIGIYSLFCADFEQYKAQTVGAMASGSQPISSLFGFDNKQNTLIHETLGLWGIFAIVLIAVCIFFLARARASVEMLKKPKSMLVCVFFLEGVLSLILSSNLIDWAVMPHFFVKMQFSFRFLSFSSFAFAAIAGPALVFVLRNVISWPKIARWQSLKCFVGETVLKKIVLLSICFLALLNIMPNYSKPVYGAIAWQYSPEFLTVEGDAVPFNLNLEIANQPEDNKVLPPAGSKIYYPGYEAKDTSGEIYEVKDFDEYGLINSNNYQDLHHSYSFGTKIGIITTLLTALFCALYLIRKRRRRSVQMLNSVLTETSPST
ncbi:MAG: hypothetical protein LBQ41_00845 [Candidatus Ancillula sp.]|jgi:hypothetical protein|nr:hypothetical protein [Candidatus Ancillula sp.]